MYSMTITTIISCIVIKLKAQIVFIKGTIPYRFSTRQAGRHYAYARTVSENS